MQLLVWKIDEEKPIKKSDRSSFEVHMSSSSEFQAVDLDAVLDEFESSQNLVEQNTTMGKEDHKSENVIKPHLLENLNALPESPPTKTVRSLFVYVLIFLPSFDEKLFVFVGKRRSDVIWRILFVYFRLTMTSMNQNMQIMNTMTILQMNESIKFVLMCQTVKRRSNQLIHNLTSYQDWITSVRI